MERDVRLALRVQGNVGDSHLEQVAQSPVDVGAFRVHNAFYGAPDDRRGAPFGEGLLVGSVVHSESLGPGDAAGDELERDPGRPPGRGEIGPRLGAHSLGTQQAGSEHALRPLRHIEDRARRDRYPQREPGAVVSAAADDRWDERRQLLAARVAGVVVDVPSQLREQGVGA